MFQLLTSKLRLMKQTRLWFQKCRSGDQSISNDNLQIILIFELYPSAFGICNYRSLWQVFLCSALKRLPPNQRLQRLNPAEEGKKNSKLSSCQPNNALKSPAYPCTTLNEGQSGGKVFFLLFIKNLNRITFPCYREKVFFFLLFIRRVSLTFHTDGLT